MGAVTQLGIEHVSASATCAARMPDPSFDVPANAGAISARVPRNGERLARMAGAKPKSRTVRPQHSLLRYVVTYPSSIADAR